MIFFTEYSYKRAKTLEKLIPADNDALSVTCYDFAITSYNEESVPTVSYAIHRYHQQFGLTLE